MKQKLLRERYGNIVLIYYENTLSDQQKVEVLEKLNSALEKKDERDKAVIKQRGRVSDGISRR